MTRSATHPIEPRHDRLVEMSERDCYRKLEGSHLGRLALSIGALPAVFPIHYALLGRDPVFRTDAGTKLTAAANGNVVCLEIDHADPLDHTGWSVMVTGPSEVLKDPDDLARAAELPLEPWVGQGDAFVRVRAALVTGRRIVNGPGRGPGKG